MDIKIDSVEGKFKFRVCGILEHNGKYLVVKMNDNNFYCLPGGHVELGEDTGAAVLREMHEELGFEVKIDRLIAINQNFFNGNDGKAFHEIGFYYVVKAKDEKAVVESDYVREELDKNIIQHLEFRWFSADDLKGIDFRPKFISDILKTQTTQIVITRD